MEIPYTKLSAEALRGVIEAFVLREGTEYGFREYTLDEKVSRVMRQLEQGNAFIVFDPEDGSCDLRQRREQRRA